MTITNVTPIDKAVFDVRLRKLLEKLEGNESLSYYDTVVSLKPSVGIETKGGRSFFARPFFDNYKERISDTHKKRS